MDHLEYLPSRGDSTPTVCSVEFPVQTCYAECGVGYQLTTLSTCYVLGTSQADHCTDIPGAENILDLTECEIAARTLGLHKLRGTSEWRIDDVNGTMGCSMRSVITGQHDQVAFNKAVIMGSLGSSCSNAWVASAYGLPADAACIGAVAFLHFAVEKTWDDAQASCVATGGTLATVENEEENQFVRSISPPDGTSLQTWLGYRRSGNQFSWVGFLVKRDRADHHVAKSPTDFHQVLSKHHVPPQCLVHRHSWNWRTHKLGRVVTMSPQNFCGKLQLLDRTMTPGGRLDFNVYILGPQSSGGVSRGLHCDEDDPTRR